MNKAILIHGRFDSISDPNSAVEQIADALRADGVDVTTLECDERFSRPFIDAWNPGDVLACLGYSNGAEQLLGILKDFEDLTMIQDVKLVVLDDPVVKSIVGQFSGEQLTVPAIVERCVTFIRADRYDPNDDTVGDNIEVVSVDADHGSLPFVTKDRTLELMREAFGITRAA